MFSFFSKRFFSTNPLRGGYKKYAEQFKNKPGSYLTSFAILHELTAVAPFPVIYYVLDSSSLKIPFDDEYLQEGNKFINKARIYYGYKPLDPDNQTMLHLVSTYCIVKVRIHNFFILLYFLIYFFF